MRTRLLSAILKKKIRTNPCCQEILERLQGVRLHGAVPWAVKSFLVLLPRAGLQETPFSVKGMYLVAGLGFCCFLWGPFQKTGSLSSPFLAAPCPRPFRFQSATGLGARGCSCSPVVRAWPRAGQIDPNWANEGFEPGSLPACPLPPRQSKLQGSRGKNTSKAASVCSTAWA